MQCHQTWYGANCRGGQDGSREGGSEGMGVLGLLLVLLLLLLLLRRTVVRVVLLVVSLTTI